MARIEKGAPPAADRDAGDDDLVEIDADEFEEARWDPRLIAFAEKADRLARDIPHSAGS